VTGANRLSKQRSWLVKSSQTRDLRAPFGDGRTGTISRREALKRASALGLGAAAAGLVVGTNGTLAQDASPIPSDASTIVMPEWINQDLSGASINVTMSAEGPELQWVMAATQRFQERSGISVNVLAGPTSATERLAQYQQLLAAGASDVDAMMIDVIWPGILAEHAVDLSDAMQANSASGYDFFERIVENNTVEDKLVGIPWFTDAGLLYFRTDLLEKYGFSEGPQTWSEMQEMANTIQEGERGEGNADFWGYVWQGAAYEGLTCNALEWQYSYGGGRIVEEGEDGEPTVVVNNDATIGAFNMARGWPGTISPPGVTTYMEEEARGVWQAGNAAFMRNWPYAFALGQGADSPIRDQFRVLPLPRGEGEGGQHADTLGGWQLMVSQYSNNVDAATLYVRYMTSLEVQKAFAVETSHLPTIPQLYEDTDVTDAQPFFAQLQEVFLGGAVARPSTITGELYNEVSTAYFTAVNQMLSGVAEVEPTLADLESQLQDIVSEL
jgi:trehalose/maltose transport system substrate-binding protein